MDEGSVGLLLLTSVAIVASILFHLRRRGFLLACFTSSITAISTLLIVDTYRRGWSPDKLLPVAFVIGTVYAFLISLVVGGIVRWWMSRRKMDAPKDQ